MSSVSTTNISGTDKNGTKIGNVWDDLEIETPGRVRLRPNRGFSLGLVRQRHPKFSLGRFDHFMPREQDREIFASRILCLTPMAAQIVVA
jgi:hypothetical protein